jgi:group II intron reverse transcriptase/maturase
MLARQMPGTALRSLSHHLDLEWMREAYRRTRKDGAVGVDGITAEDFAADLDANLRDLLDRAKSGTYRAPPVRRVEIPKDGGKTRLIGIPTFEDKVLQRAVVMLLEPIYEQEFYDFSHGFRPGRSAHSAYDSLRKELWDMRGGWVLDADVSKFFDTLDKQQLREMLRTRVVDGVVIRLIGKWLNAGVMTEGCIVHPTAGTPQGGVISPLLANIYLHEVVDGWWAKDVVPRMRGRTALVRYADDFVMVFSEEQDALRVREVLARRLDRFGLTLHPEKTRLVRFKRPRFDGGGPRSGTFEFVGFMLYWGRSRRGWWALKVKTARSRLARGLLALKEWMARNRHTPVSEQARALSRKLRGHYNYYGVPGNSDSLRRFRQAATRRWRRALSRRSQQFLTWERFGRILQHHPLPPARLPPWRHRQLRLAKV